MKDEELFNIFHQSYPNPKTRNNYCARLEKLKEVCGGNNKSIVDIILDPEQSYACMKERYANISTRKNAITVVLALFKHSEQLRNLLGAEKVARWKKYHDDMVSFQDASYKKNLPTDKQFSKYTTLNEMKAKYKELKAAPDPHSTLQNSQWLVFLSMCVSFPPKRADYGNMRIYMDRDPRKKDENYVVLRRDKNAISYMVFNLYKTAGIYETVTEDLPLQTYTDVMDSVRRWPRTHLFVNRFGKPMKENNAFSKYVTRMFEALFGRSTGVTMLRHIYITEKVDFNNMSDEQLEDISRQMMHSTTLQRKYNWSKSLICQNLCNNGNGNKRQAHNARDG